MLTCRFRCRAFILMFSAVTVFTCQGCGKSDQPLSVEKAAPAVTPEPASLVPTTSIQDAVVWPTEEEAKAAILKIEYAINASDTNKSIWKVTDFRHEVKSVKFAQKTISKQMNFGATAIPVFPTKILYTQITDYDGKPTTRVEAGADGVWFLYRDSFGEWTGKYGNE